MSERPIRPEDIEHVRFSVVRRGYDPQAVDQFLVRVTAAYRELEAAAAAEPRSPAEEIGSEVASIIEVAHQSASEVLAAAEREAYAIRTAAIQEGAEATLAAKKQMEMAHEARQVAEKEGDAIRSAARNDASLYEQEVRERAFAIEQEARERADKMERAARANVAAVLAEARTRYEKLRDAQQNALTRLSAIESLVRQAREEAGAEDDDESVLRAPVELHTRSDSPAPRKLTRVPPGSRTAADRGS